MYIVGSVAVKTCL